jgi:hypothetical protein
MGDLGGFPASNEAREVDRSTFLLDRSTFLLDRPINDFFRTTLPFFINDWGTVIEADVSAILFSALGLLQFQILTDDRTGRSKILQIPLRFSF